MNRWGLNKKKSVGPVSELIRKCSPKKLEDWETFYYENVYPKTHLEDLGRKLYIKISEVIQSEVQDVSEDDCIAYIKDVVIERTFEGYQTEIQTVYGFVQNELKKKVEAAPDEWDRLYNVDFFIRIGNYYIGIQIKPLTFEHTFEDHKWKEMQQTTHAKFKNKYGGSVYTIFSIKSGDKKIIKNPEIMESIKREIQELSK